jgi:hypothetical protein
MHHANAMSEWPGELAQKCGLFPTFDEVVQDIWRTCGFPLQQHCIQRGDAYPGRQQQNRAIVVQGEQVARRGNHQPLAGAKRLVNIA